MSRTLGSAPNTLDSNPQQQTESQMERSDLRVEVSHVVRAAMATLKSWRTRKHTMTVHMVRHILPHARLHRKVAPHLRRLADEDKIQQNGGSPSATSH